VGLKRSTDRVPCRLDDVPRRVDRDHIRNWHRADEKSGMMINRAPPLRGGGTTLDPASRDARLERRYSLSRAVLPTGRWHLDGPQRLSGLAGNVAGFWGAAKIS
jgi:hypothetical protein